MREVVELKAPGDRVFEYLSRSGKSGLEVHSRDKEMRRVVLRSGMGLLSWGEEVEASIVNQDQGCKVILDGRSLHPFNITADISSRIKQVLDDLKAEFG